jgi:hypothetical protein
MIRNIASKEPIESIVGQGNEWYPPAFKRMK